MMYLSIIHCFGGPCYWDDGVLSFRELIMFTLVSLVLITILLFYYNKISNKGNGEAGLLNIATYSSKDVFSQEIVGDSNFALTEKTTSMWTRITVYILLVLMVTTSMYKLLGITGQYFYF